MRALLDVSVLIALLDADHVYHEQAGAWLAARAEFGWASCAITQNGCVRIMSQPAYPNHLTTSAVMARLQAAIEHPAHAFWPCDLNLLDSAVVRSDRLHGPRQVTDVYLLALAVRHGGTFATFDKRVPLSAVVDANDTHLSVI